MKAKSLRIIMNGVTGRMGTNQHLVRSILAIREQGGTLLADGRRVMPEPVLVGRDRDKLEALARSHGLSRYTTNLDEALDDAANEVYFDAQTTATRADGIRRAVDAGKAIYCEKPTAVDTGTALDLFRRCRKAGLKNGVVQDKLWLPGFIKLKGLIEAGFFGRILSVRGEFGYWVFDGSTQPPQRPSWNYRKEDGGGMASDMLCHWRYLIDNLFGNVKAVNCVCSTHIPERFDEKGRRYVCTADDAAYATFETDSGILVGFNSSWCVRVRRDDLLTLQVDGTSGSAVAGLRDCWVQSDSDTPRATWNPDVPQSLKFFDNWKKLPDQGSYDNAFKVQWELFIRHVVADEPFRWSLLEGAKGVQLAERGMISSAKRSWILVEPLAAD
jgi:predicted dehydrogenase